MMEWIPVTNEDEIIALEKTNQPFALFKDSTTCFISKRVKKLFETDANAYDQKVPVYYLDLLRYRTLSNQIAEHWGVQHESPQLIIIQGKKVLYHASHSDIEFADILRYLS